MSETLEKEVKILLRKIADLEIKTTRLTQAGSQKENLITRLEQMLNEQRQQTAKAEEEREKARIKIAHITAEYHALRQAFLDAQRIAFGKKSERFVDDSARQLSLFEEDSDQIETKNEDIEKITYTRKKSKGKHYDKSLLPQREEIIQVAESERICPCGCEKQLIKYDLKHILNYQPAIFEVVVQKREVLGCKKGCEQSMVTALAPKHILPKCRASESLLTHIVISKVLDRQPLYHLEKKIEREHYWRIPRQTMSRWLIQLSEKLQPLVNLIKEQIIEYDIAAIDATSLQVLNEPNRLAETKSYAYCIRGGPPDKQAIIYEYNGDYKPVIYTHKQYVADTLAGFNGTLLCDAAETFDEIGNRPKVTLSYCHAHARRKFEAIEKMRQRGKGKKSKPGLAHHVLKNIYQPLYRIERKAKGKKLTPSEIKEYRHKHSKPILDAWHKWLIEHKELTLKESPIGKAIKYALNQWDGLQIYLTDGRIEIDNNATERDIKPFVMARKNFLFACTQAGADSLGVHFTLILTAKAHRLNPVDYYMYILKQIPFCKSFEDYNRLLPWNFKES